MEATWTADRIALRQLVTANPHWSAADLAAALNRSLSWAKKWLRRLREADPADDTLVRGRSRAPKTRPDRISQPVIDAILDIRDDPPENLQRIPGPKAILYYLGRRPDLATARLPRSTRTIWRILKQAGRIEIPGRGRRKRGERPAPMTEWELDFFDIDTVQPEPDTTKQQHLVEALPVIDRGTNLLLGCVPRADYTMVTAIGEVVVIVQRHGLPESIVIDRDPRFVGGNPRADFPSPLVQLWQCLGVKVRICPPRRPDRKPMIERMNLTLLLECVRRFRPATLAEAIVYLAWFEQHSNAERPHQGPTCNNQPPRTAHPVLPERPTVPAQVDPNAWLWHYDGNVLTRRVQRDTSISVGDERYYVRQELVGHQVQVRIAAATKELVVLHEQREVKRLALKGLAPQQSLPFDAWVTQLQEAARTGQRRPGGPRQFALPL